MFTNNRILLLCIFTCLTVSGCAKGPSPDYVYKPARLTECVIEDVNLAVKQMNEKNKTSESDMIAEFNEEQSLFILTFINDDDRYYFESGAESRFYNIVCSGSDPLITELHKNNIGIQINQSGVYDSRSFGPWGSDVCIKPANES